jgi:uncharacterized membrane protein YphA (DoxX/SURF4 family)
MTSETPKSKLSPILIIATAARLLLGAVFIYMGVVKALHPIDFLKLVRQYEMTSNHVLLNSIAGMLPWFEIFCGVLLCLGVAVRGAGIVTLAMLVPFTILVIHRAQGIAALKHIPFCMVKFNCGCGGAEMFICSKVAENAGLIALALIVVALKPGFGIKPELIGSEPPVSVPSTQRVVADPSRFE